MAVRLRRRVVGLVTVLAVASLLAFVSPVPVAGASAAPGGPAELGFCGGDDWEPSIAADSSGHVYVLITHYQGDTTCDPASGLHNARIMIQVSGDGGKTFGPPRVVADAPGGIAYPSQADPAIAVDQSSGAVYVSFLAYGLSGGHTDVYVARSTNFGRGFTAVKANSHDCKNCDHPKTLVSGRDVYVAYSQATNHFISRSTDAGRSFTETDVLRQGVVGFAEGGVVDSRGNAWFAWADCQTSSCKGVPAADYRVSETLAGTSKTRFAAVATGDQGPACPFGSACGFRSSARKMTSGSTRPAPCIWCGSRGKIPPRGAALRSSTCPGAPRIARPDPRGHLSAGWMTRTRPAAPARPATPCSRRSSAARRDRSTSPGSTIATATRLIT
jgi:hypothetical protein